MTTKEAIEYRLMYLRWLHVLVNEPVATAPREPYYRAPGPMETQDRTHADAIWMRFESYRSGHHQGAGYALSHPSPFDNWRIEQRYAHQSNFDRPRVQMHQTGAQQVRDLVEKAAREGLLCRRVAVAQTIRKRLQIIAALVPELEPVTYLEGFRESAHDLFGETLYDEIPPAGEEGDDIDGWSFDLTSEDAPHSPWAVRWHRGFASLRTLHERFPSIDDGEIRHVFGDLIGNIVRWLGWADGYPDARGSL